MPPSRFTATLVVVVDLLAGIPIVTEFVIPEQLFAGIGLYLFLAACLVEIPYAYFSIKVRLAAHYRSQVDVDGSVETLNR